MAALSSTGNGLVGPKSSFFQNRDPISPPFGGIVMMMKGRTRMQRLRAEAIASNSSSSSSVSDLYSSFYRGQPAAAAASAVFDFKKTEEEEEKKRDSVTAEKLDQWIRDSIGEIVRNIGEAPLLVQIFSQGPSTLRLETEQASPESWPLVKKRWDQSSCVPDGVILVEELKDKEEEDEAAATGDTEGGCSRTWGLVVQGRGMDCAAPCYILNTCRVRSSAGFCTHYCLVRAKCFGEASEKQLGKAWLQGNVRKCSH